MLGGLEIKLLDPISLYDGHPGFFPVAGVDQHPHCHYIISVRASGRSKRIAARELGEEQASRRRQGALPLRVSG